MLHSSNDRNSSSSYRIGKDKENPNYLGIPAGNLGWSPQLWVHQVNQQRIPYLQI